MFKCDQSVSPIFRLLKKGKAWQHLNAKQGGKRGQGHSLKSQLPIGFCAGVWPGGHKDDDDEDIQHECQR